jgi:hypothetical protein
MSVVFMDGGDHLATADLLKKWDALNGCVVSTNPVRTGGGALRFTDNQHYVRKMGLPAHSTYIICGAYYFTALPVDWEIATFYETATQAQACIRLNNGAFTIYRGNEAASLGSSGAGLVAAGQWLFIESKLVVHATAGSVTIRINGVQVYQVTGQNTQGGASLNVNGVGLGASYPGAGAFGGVNVDDFFALNGAGSVNNDFIGDRHVGTLLPTGQGTYAEFARTGGSVAGNYTAVSEAAMDGDTSYVSSSTVGQRDTYTYPALPAVASAVTAVQFNLMARKDDSLNPRTIAPMERNGTTDYVGTPSADLGTGYLDVFSVAELSLATGAAWGVGEIPASQFGVRVQT